MELPARLARLPSRPGPAGLEVRIARGWRARLLGLAGIEDLPPRCALLLPRTRSVHTFGMRFALDLVWLNDAGDVVRIDRAVPARRVRWCRRARAVLELSSCPRSDPRRA